MAQLSSSNGDGDDATSTSDSSFITISGPSLVSAETSAKPSSSNASDGGDLEAAEYRNSTKSKTKSSRCCDVVLLAPDSNTEGRRIIAQRVAHITVSGRTVAPGAVVCSTGGSVLAPVPTEVEVRARRRYNADDRRWSAIESLKTKYGRVGMEHMRLVKKVGKGDIGEVYLAEVAMRSSEEAGAGEGHCWFAVKIMDWAPTENAAAQERRWRKQQLLQRRAAAELDILRRLDHPFLPCLYAHFETKNSLCLLMDFCPGGDLHSVRQRQPQKRFSEDAARFYVAEVIVALEYLHLMGVIYRDLKPENVLVRQDGHIMLSDFDLSLRCPAEADTKPKLVKSASTTAARLASAANRPPTPSSRSPFPAYCGGATRDSEEEPAAEPSCLLPKLVRMASLLRSSRNASSKIHRSRSTNTNITRSYKLGDDGEVLPETVVVTEPTEARSMSFVGTHEYLAPEIIRGEGHGSAVDWWALGVFLYELLYGATPFKGASNRATLFNVIGQPLSFPGGSSSGTDRRVRAGRGNSGASGVMCTKGTDREGGAGTRICISDAAKDLIARLLVKEPQHRLASRLGSVEIKQHPFFAGVNWALIRSMAPPFVPDLLCSSLAISQPPSPLVPDVSCSSSTISQPPPPSTEAPCPQFEFF